MKELIYSQFNPQKTMMQLLTDRGIYRLLILAGLAASLLQ